MIIQKEKEIMLQKLQGLCKNEKMEFRKKKIMLQKHQGLCKK